MALVEAEILLRDDGTAVAVNVLDFPGLPQPPRGGRAVGCRVPTLDTDIKEASDAVRETWAWQCRLSR